MDVFQSSSEPCARVRSDAALVASQNAHVTVCPSAAERLARQLADELDTQQFSLAQWQGHPLHPSSCDDINVEWVFLIDLLNYSFFSDTGAPPFTVEYNGKYYTGYWSLCAAVNRAIEEGIDLRNATVRANLTLPQFQTIFRSSTATSAPLLKMRYEHMVAASKTLIDLFDGKFMTLVKAAHHNAQALIGLVLTHFPTFRDVSQWQDQEVYILKRAQILVADLWGCFQGQGAGRFDDIAELTMFADYRVPQSLVYFGLLQYSPELLATLKSGSPLEHDDPREVAIRACSIHAVEVLKGHVLAALKERGAEDVTLNAVILDFYLWDIAKAETAKMADVPIHHTRCWFY